MKIAFLLVMLSGWFTIARAQTSHPSTMPAELQQMLQMPGQSYRGELEQATPAQIELADRLRGDVKALATDIGERNVRKPGSLKKTVDFLTRTMTQIGYRVSVLPYDANGVAVENLEIEIKGSATPDEIIVVGAHYDSVPKCPAANDNGSGVAGVIEMARALKDAKPARTIRFVFFVNEEMPFFLDDKMGSAVYAKRCKDRGDKIVAMFSIETIGYYSDEKGSQKYPKPFEQFFPTQGNFIAFVGNVESLPLVRESIGIFRDVAKFPSEGIGAPAQVPGIRNSDHASFWAHGYPGVMITDTANFRYPHYHLPTDTPDKIDFDRMSRVVEGMTKVVAKLAG